MSDRTCFVVMGFGKKTDFETGRTLDLDNAYRNVIKPAVEDAGLQCIRADEIVHSGLIDVPMYEHLLNADVVIADLSTANRNAFYELGVRHALRPHTTIVIAEDGIKPPFPFDLSHLAIRQYHHLGEDIGVTEANRFRALLRDTLKTLLGAAKRECDSPVHRFLTGLKVGKETAGGNPPTAPAGAPAAAATHSAIMKQVDEAQSRKDFTTAKQILEKVLEEMRQEAAKVAGDVASAPKGDPYIIQRLALVTYKSKAPTEIEALEKAREVLAVLEPQTSNDTETLGLWGAVHKRLWETTKRKEHLDEAVRAYERGFYLRNDYYNGINFAFLLNVRAAAQTEPAEAIADFVQAARVRREVLSICEQWLASNPPPDEDKVTAKAMRAYHESKYWVLATQAEATLGVDAAKAEPLYQQAYELAPISWMVDSTKEQRGKLEPLLVDSPLRHLGGGGSGVPAPKSDD